MSEFSSVLEQYRTWLIKTARGIRQYNTVVSAEDLCQEGAIAMWRAFDAYDETRGPLDLWLKAKARWKMISVATSKLGDSPEQATDDFEILEFAVISIDLDMAYHQGEIYDAIYKLSPKQREYVVRRFWYGQQTRELIAAFGYDPQAFWSSPRNGAKHKLKEMLAHLSVSATSVGD